MKRTGIQRHTRLRSVSEKKATEAKSVKPSARGATRGAWINRTTKQRKPRKASETERAHGSAEFRAWIKTLPCAFCGVVGYSDAAHVRNGGVGRKADCRFLIPACRNVPLFGAGIRGAATVRPGCHNDLDQHKKSWREKYDTDAMAERYAALWQAHTLGGTRE